MSIHSVLSAANDVIVTKLVSVLVVFLNETSGRSRQQNSIIWQSEAPNGNEIRQGARMPGLQECQSAPKVFKLCVDLGLNE